MCSAGLECFRVLQSVAKCFKILQYTLERFSKFDIFTCLSIGKEAFSISNIHYHSIFQTGSVSNIHNLVHLNHQVDPLSNWCRTMVYQTSIRKCLLSQHLWHQSTNRVYYQPNSRKRTVSTHYLVRLGFLLFLYNRSMHHRRKLVANHFRQKNSQHFQQKSSQRDNLFKQENSARCLFQAWLKVLHNVCNHS